MMDYFDQVELQIGQLIERGAHRGRGGRIAPAWLVVPVRPKSSVARRTLGAVTLVLSSLLAIGVGAVFVFALRGNGQGTGMQTGAGGVPEVLLYNFSILRRPSRPGDLPPPQLFPATRASISSRLGLLPRAARRATFPGYSAWLLPGRHGICLGYIATDGEGGSGCTDLQLSLMNDMLRSETPGRGATILGLATDHVRSIVRVTQGAVQQIIPVALHHGFYATRAGPDAIVGVTLDGPQLVDAGAAAGRPARQGLDIQAPAVVYNGQSAPSGAGPWRTWALPVTATLSADRHVEILVSGTRGLRAEAGWEVTCGGGAGQVGGDFRFPVRVPAVLLATLPQGGQMSCYMSVLAQAHSRAVLRVAIAEY